jgi:predicted membrane-bound spermidine synthase
MFLFIEKNAGPTNKQRIWTPRKVLCNTTSDYQEISIIDTDDFGEVLFLDGVMQSSRVDDAPYHCQLVHPALYMKWKIHCKRRDTHLWNVLILGGGEGCTMREVLTAYRVEKATQIDIDGDLVDLFRGPFAHWNGGAYEDRRAEVRIEDAVEWAKSMRPLREDARDAVFIDLVEPGDFGKDWGKLLLGACFAVKSSGVLSAYVGTMAAGEYDMIEEGDLWKEFCSVLKSSFSTSSWKPVHYCKYMPSWGGYAVFFAASSMSAEAWRFEFSDTEGCEYISKMIGFVGGPPPLDLWEEDA